MLQLKKCPPHLVQYYLTLLGFSHVPSNCTEDGGFMYKGYGIHIHKNTDRKDIHIGKTDRVDDIVGGRNYIPGANDNVWPEFEDEDILYSIDEHS